MFKSILAQPYVKILAWGLAALALNALLLLPLPAWLALSAYDQLAFAQTGPPDDTATPPPTATTIPTSTPLPPATPLPPTPIILKEIIREKTVIEERTISSTAVATSTAVGPTATFTPLPTATPTIPATATQLLVVPVATLPVTTSVVTAVVTATPTPLPATATPTLAPLSPLAPPTAALLLPLPSPTVPLATPTLAPSPEPAPAGLFAGAWSPWLLFLAMLSGLLGVIALFLLLGGGSALRSLFRPGPPAAATTPDQAAAGLVLAFSTPEPAGETGALRVNLAHLPGASAPAEPAGPGQAEGRLKLPDIGLEASVSRVRPGILRHRGAIVLPAGLNLLSWNGHSIRQPAGVVYAGRLLWRGREEGFSRLYDLQPGSPVEVLGQSGDTGLYTVDSIQNYQADLAAAVEVPLAGPANRLLLVAWSEGYDIDQEEYRDYLVVQAHQAGAGPAGQPAFDQAGTRR